MNLLQKHAALVAELNDAKVGFQGLAARLGGSTEAQKLVDNIGVRLIELERTTGVADARHLLAHSTVSDDLPIFEGIVAKYSAPVDWANEIQAGNVAAENLEAKIAGRTQILEEARRSIATLTRLRTEAGQRRKKFSSEVLAIAGAPDPISNFERENWERLYIDVRAERASNSIFDKILQPA